MLQILGMVQNMAYFSCKCGEKTYLFGKDGVRRTAEKYNVPLLGELPLEVAVQENSDAGKRNLFLNLLLFVLVVWWFGFGLVFFFIFFFFQHGILRFVPAIVVSDPNSPASQAFKE